MIVCLISVSQQVEYDDELRKIGMLGEELAFLDSIEETLLRIDQEKPTLVIVGSMIGDVEAAEFVSILFGGNIPYSGPALVLAEKSEDLPAVLHSRDQVTQRHSSAEVIDIVETVASIVHAQRVRAPQEFSADEAKTLERPIAPNAASLDPRDSCAEFDAELFSILRAAKHFSPSAAPVPRDVEVEPTTIPVPRLKTSEAPLGPEGTPRKSSPPACRMPADSGWFDGVAPAGNGSAVAPATEPLAAEPAAAEPLAAEPAAIEPLAAEANDSPDTSNPNGFTSGQTEQSELADTTGAATDPSEEQQPEGAVQASPPSTKDASLPDPAEAMLPSSPNPKIRPASTRPPAPAPREPGRPKEPIAGRPQRPAPEPRPKPVLSPKAPARVAPWPAPAPRPAAADQDLAPPPESTTPPRPDSAPPPAPEAPVPEATARPAHDAPAPEATARPAPDAPVPEPTARPAHDAPAPEATARPAPEAPVPEATARPAPEAPVPEATARPAPDAPDPVPVPHFSLGAPPEPPRPASTTPVPVIPVAAPPIDAVPAAREPLKPPSTPPVPEAREPLKPPSIPVPPESSSAAPSPTKRDDRATPAPRPDAQGSRSSEETRKKAVLKAMIGIGAAAGIALLAITARPPVEQRPSSAPEATQESPPTGAIPEPSIPAAAIAPRPQASAHASSAQPPATSAQPATSARPPIGTHGEPLLVRNFPLSFRRSGGGPILTSMKDLQALVAEVQAEPHGIIELVGHSSNDGDKNPEVDMQIGRMRAESAKMVLVGQGVSAERIKIGSAGSNEPVAPNDTEENRKRNRRVVLKMYAR